jgi:hypothetical protein
MDRFWCQNLVMNAYPVEKSPTMRPGASISFVMALRRPQFVAQFSTVVWTVYHEVRKFCFWRALQRLQKVPSKPDLSLNLTFRRVIRPDTADLLQDLDEERSLPAPAEFWNKTMRRHSGTIHHSATARMIRQMLPIDKGYDQLMVVMDGEFTPGSTREAASWLSPAKASHDYVVISLLPLDPYFGVEQALIAPAKEIERQLIVKQRLRAACLSIIGPFCGLLPCHWQDCFMYERAHAVRHLDRMTKLGHEHAAELPTFDFGEISFSESGDPSRIEEIVCTPVTKKSSA